MLDPSNEVFFVKQFFYTRTKLFAVAKVMLLLDIALILFLFCRVPDFTRFNLSILIYDNQFHCIDNKTLVKNT